MHSVTCESCEARHAIDAYFCGMCGKRVRVVRRSLSGEIVDDLYRVEEKIAKGGFATIYRAVYLPSKLHVALKILHADLATDARVVERFRREAKILSRLRDLHTIATYDYGETLDGTHYIAMELLDGETLHDRLHASGPLPWREVLAIMRGVCSSLGEAHAHGIVHRDVKPANIFLKRGHIVKLLDFGLAKIRREGDEDLTRAGQAVGTMQYMPPEQLVGVDCDGRTDIYALGVVAYEMLTGLRPFHDEETASALLRAVLSRKVDPASSLRTRREAPDDVDALLRRCLAAEPEDRFATVGELAAEIERVLAIPMGSGRRRAQSDPMFVERLSRDSIPRIRVETDPPAPQTRLYWRFVSLAGFLAGGVGLGTAVARLV